MEKGVKMDKIKKLSHMWKIKTIYVFRLILMRFPHLHVCFR
jgi:hypothetical protein